jgi:hypothetical protein
MVCARLDHPDAGWQGSLSVCATIGRGGPWRGKLARPSIKWFSDGGSKIFLGPLPLTGALSGLSVGDPPYYPRHEPRQTREQCRRQRPLVGRAAIPLPPVHSSACKATDTLLRRCNLGARRVRVSNWRMRPFGPLSWTFTEVPRENAIAVGAFAAIRQVGPTRRVGPNRHVGGGDRTSG